MEHIYQHETSQLMLSILQQEYWILNAQQMGLDFAEPIGINWSNGGGEKITKRYKDYIPEVSLGLTSAVCIAAVKRF